MRLEDVMTEDVERAAPGESVAGALERMQNLRIRHLVVMEGSRVAGVVSDRDLAAEGMGRTVGERMTSDPVTAHPDTTVREAANLLRGRIIGCLPILEGHKLVGIVTTSDLLELLGRGAERPVPTARRPTLRGRGPRQRNTLPPRR